MEAHAQSVEDNLVSGLSFKLAPGASYVTDRKSVTYWPSGSSEYKVSGGVKVAKINLTGDAWLDPGTVKVMFTVANTSTEKSLRPFVIGGHNWFRRLRVICGGQTIEDIDNYNRTVEMFHMMQSKEKRLNDMVEGLGGSTTNTPGALLAVGSGNSERVVSMTLLSGLFNQEKFLPIKYCPIQIELELVNSSSDCCRESVAAHDGSQDFVIKDVQVKCDLITLDNGFDNEIAAHLLSGKNLPINFGSYNTSVQVANGDKNSISVSRALTRLKSVFTSMFRVPDNNQLANEVNLFSHHMGQAEDKYDSTKEVQFEMSVGSHKWPEYPIKSIAESYYQLKKTLGIHGSAFHTMDIQEGEYNNNKFVIGIDTEKMLGASFTGFNSKSGDLMTIKLDNTGLRTGIDRIFVVLHYDAVLQINDTGVIVYE